MTARQFLRKVRETCADMEGDSRTANEHTEYGDRRLSKHKYTLHCRKLSVQIFDHYVATRKKKTSMSKSVHVPIVRYAITTTLRHSKNRAVSTHCHCCSAVHVNTLLTLSRICYANTKWQTRVLSLFSHKASAATLTKRASDKASAFLYYRFYESILSKRKEKRRERVS